MNSKNIDTIWEILINSGAVPGGYGALYEHVKQKLAAVELEPETKLMEIIIAEGGAESNRYLFEVPADMDLDFLWGQTEQLLPEAVANLSPHAFPCLPEVMENEVLHKLRYRQPRPNKLIFSGFGSTCQVRNEKWEKYDISPETHEALLKLEQARHSWRSVSEYTTWAQELLEHPGLDVETLCLALKDDKKFPLLDGVIRALTLESDGKLTQELRLKLVELLRPCQSELKDFNLLLDDWENGISEDYSLEGLSWSALTPPGPLLGDDE